MLPWILFSVVVVIAVYLASPLGFYAVESRYYERLFLDSARENSELRREAVGTLADMSKMVTKSETFRLAVRDREDKIKELEKRLANFRKKIRPFSPPGVAKTKYDAVKDLEAAVKKLGAQAGVTGEEQKAIVTEITEAGKNSAKEV